MKMQTYFGAGFFLRFKIHLEMELEILYTRNLYYFFDYSSKFFEITLGCITNFFPIEGRIKKPTHCERVGLG